MKRLLASDDNWEAIVKELKENPQLAQEKDLLQYAIQSKDIAHYLLIADLQKNKLSYIDHMQAAMKANNIPLLSYYVYKDPETWKQIAPKPTIFYYHEQPNYILSNFYPHIPGKKCKSLNILFEKVSWPTSEHLYQALKFKCETQKEKEWREYIRTASTPGIAKHLGHSLKTRRYKWQQDASKLVEEYKNLVQFAGDCQDNQEGCFREEIMKIALQAKFDSVKEFRKALLETKDQALMEDTDTDWGWRNGRLGRLLEELRNVNL